MWPYFLVTWHRPSVRRSSPIDARVRGNISVGPFDCLFVTKTYAAFINYSSRGQRAERPPNTTASYHGQTRPAVCWVGDWCGSAESVVPRDFAPVPAGVARSQRSRWLTRTVADSADETAAAAAAAANQGLRLASSVDARCPGRNNARY